ncbi:MAG: type I methionyl aminopeptidase [Candidatus Uhrbacteria bacterium]|nr:type I methionyl aminopeptidase [Candidatus Uhrbacteria bacterium]
MALIKTPKEIAILKKGGALLSSVLREVRAACVAGVTTKSLDDLAQKLIKKHGGTPSFLNYRISPSDPGYPAALCVSVNDEVVHGIPSKDRIIQDGDIVGLDIGMWLEGLCTDMASTVMVGNVPKKTQELVRATREGLVRGISTIRAGGTVGDIGDAIEAFIKPKGFGIVRDLVGHGVGHSVHEDPNVPNYSERSAHRIPLVTGMVLAIEPMINLKGWRIYQRDDGWTIATEDGSPSAHFEVTIVVTDDGYELITPFPDEEVAA